MMAKPYYSSRYFADNYKTESYRIQLECFWVLYQKVYRPLPTNPSGPIV